MSNKIISTGTNDTCLDISKLLQKNIEIIAKDEGYIKYIVKKEIFPMDGNFLSMLYEVNIIGDTADGAKETSLLIKTVINLDKITLSSGREIFSREIFVYDDLSRVFARLQIEANVPIQQRFKVLKTYKCTEEMIIMENLAKKGFMTYHRTQVVSKKFAELSVIALAKFHALSFVIREKIPKYYEDKIRIIRSPLNLDSDWRSLIDNTCAAAAQALTGEVRAKIANYGPRLCQLYKKYLQDAIPKHGCVVHGDYKLTNILVKEVNGEPTEVLPIDYQLLYYSSPVDDFLLFIFSGTDREFRRKHLNYLKELYFQTFTKFLKYFDVDVNSSYSRQDFEADFQERFELGLVFGLYLAIYTFANIEKGFDVTKLSLSELPLIPNEMFNDRVRGIVEDYIEWGYL